MRRKTWFATVGGMTSFFALIAAACTGQSRNADGYLRGADTTSARETFIVATGSATNVPSKRTAAGGHPVDYYISVPKGWPGKRAWPIVLTVSGSSKNFASSAEQFSQERDRRGDPFIIVTPILFTNSGDKAVPRDHPAYNYPPAVWDLVDKMGRCAFDLESMRAVLADVREHFAGDSKMFLTGFSGGGNTSWATVLLEPELFRGAAMVATNYGGRCVSQETTTPMRISTAPERVQLPIRTFNGEDDSFRPMGTKQQATAMEIARANGFANMSTEIVPKMGHDPMPKNVLSYFVSLLPANQR